MQIRVNKKAEKVIWEHLAKYLSEDKREYQPGRYHVSDLLNPRQTFFKVLDPKPIKQESLGYFTAGRAHHEILQKVLPGTPEHRVEVTVDGITIVGTIDLMLSYPVELKTSRKWTIPDTPEPHYVDQLKFYCALTGKLKGKIIVFYITPGRKFGGKGNSTTPEFRIWDIELTQEELDEVKVKMFEVAKNLDGVLASAKLNGPLAQVSNIHRALPLCQSFLCGGKYKGNAEVKCEWYEKCKPEGRYPKENLS